MSKQHSWLPLSTALILILSAVGCSSSTEIPTGAVSGTITVNGSPVEGVIVTFVPDAAVRPSTGVTDTRGNYQAEFVSTQSGVALGPCVVQFALYPGKSEKNCLPAKFNTKAADNPDLHLNVTEEGLAFDYDIVYDGVIPTK
ncbi:hypothetical protein GC197_08725 [bacterium]|nr:hypothetical protein [bacterium]